jgi:transposase
VESRPRIEVDFSLTGPRVARVPEQLRQQGRRPQLIQVDNGSQFISKALDRELGRKNITLDLLWNEYKAQEPDGYGYSWFCTHYERWAASLPVTLRQTYVPGETLFIDYSGNRLGIVDPHTGEIRQAENTAVPYATSSWQRHSCDRDASRDGDVGRPHAGSYRSSCRPFRIELSRCSR